MGFLVKQRLFFGGGGGLAYMNILKYVYSTYIYIFVRFVVTGSN